MGNGLSETLSYEAAGMLALLLITSLLQASPDLARSTEDCGFSQYRRAHKAHFVEENAVSKVTPEYPDEAKAKGLSGTVRIRILVNKQGRVEKTCPVYLADEPKPHRMLVAAAEAAARQWVFRPNFGFPNDWKVKSARLLEAVLVFQFVPPKPSKTTDDQPKP